MSKKVLTGYNYAAVSAAPATIKDANGITICEVKVGQIAYFTATTDIVDCGTDDVHVVQIRSNYTVPSTGGGGGVDPTPYLERIAELEGLIDAIEQVIAALEADITAKRTQIAELQGQLAELQAELAELQAIMDDNRGRIIGINDAGSAVQMGQYLTQGGLFYQRQDIGEWYGSLPSLTDNRGSSGHGFFQESSITGFHGDLPLLTSGYQMFGSCTDLGTFEVPSGELPEITNGFGMFQSSGLKSFSADMPKLTTAQSMFHYCSELETFELPSGQMPQHLTTTQAMFADCSSLTEFNYTLPSGITTATYMMYGTAIESFASDIPQNCQDARYMFQNCTKLETFTGRLHINRLQCQNMFQGCTSLKTLWPEYAGQEFPWSLRNVNYMFQDCTSLESFPFTLTSAYGICTSMFQGCSKLQWTTPLPTALRSAVGFFSGCKLNKASVQTIVDSPTRTSTSYITIGIDSTLITQEEQDAYNTQLVNKRWQVTWERN